MRTLRERVLREYVDHYNRERPHRALELRAPDPPPQVIPGSVALSNYDVPMQRTQFREMTCSIARSLDVAGEWWTPLILRDIWLRRNRFDWR